MNNVDPDGGGSNNWYNPIGTNFIQWFDGSAEIPGYINLGSQLAAWYNIGDGVLKWTSFFSDGTKGWSLSDVVISGPKSFTTSAIAQINSNCSCHGDYIQLRTAAFNKWISAYNLLDHAHGQVDFPQSWLTEKVFGGRDYSGIDPTNGKSIENSPVDQNGYLTHQPTMYGVSPFGLISPRGN